MQETLIKNNTVKKYLPKWKINDIKQMLDMPFFNLIDRARKIHKVNFNSNEIQISSLLSIKTGSCPEDCAYCPQSAHYNTGLKKETLMEVEQVVTEAKKSKESGASRFCMGAAWRSPNDRDLPKIIEMIKQVKNLGLETCMTLGMLNEKQAKTLKKAGLDYYNHNIDTSAEYYSKIISTRSFQDRINTLENVRHAGINVCSGGILGMGETLNDAANMIITLANMEPYPESVPINKLIPIKGTPLEASKPHDDFDFIRLIAIARITMPKSRVRLSAGREDMNQQMQALCFYAGANSIFYCEKLLTAKNQAMNCDEELFKKLQLKKI